MARRGAGGYSSLQRHLDSANSYSNLSSSLAEQQTAALLSQIATFQQSLSQFSTTHRAQILSSPSFRSHFSQLCAELGVDPLGGGAKGIWDKMGFGDWYFALGVQIVDVCLHARDRAGGMVAIEEVIRAVMVLRRGQTPSSTAGKTPTTPSATTTADISPSDVQRAIAALDPLGCGYSVLTLQNGRQVVRCYPTSSSASSTTSDSLVIVEAASANASTPGSVSLRELHTYTNPNNRRPGESAHGGWSLDRCERALERACAEEGLLWIDEQGSGDEGGRTWFVPALWDFVDGL